MNRSVSLVRWQSCERALALRQMPRPIPTTFPDTPAQWNREQAALALQEDMKCAAHL
jgi:hypothetical protein